MGKYQYGFCEWYLPFCGPDTLRFCKEMGYEGIQIADMGGASQNYPMSNPRLADAYMEMSEKTGIEIQCMDILSVVYDGSLRADPDSTLGKQAFMTMRKAFEACRYMGIKAAFIPSVLQTRIDNVFHFHNTGENLRRGKQLADDMGIEFLYESFSPVDKTRALCEKAGGMRLMYDTLNPLKYGFADDPVNEILDYGTEMIHTIHFKDCNAAFSSDVPLGSGIGRVANCAGAIRQIGYEGWIINEGTYFRSEGVTAGADPWELAAADLQTLKNLLEENEKV